MEVSIPLRSPLLPVLSPDQPVRVDQTILTRDGPWTTTIEGRVVSCTPRPTGSWYAHGKDDRLWLMKLRLRKDDGELVDLVLDARSIVTPLDEK